MNPHELLEVTIEARKRKLQGASLATLLIILDTPQTVGKIAGEIGISSAAMTGLADKLCAESLVIRSSVPGDRRKWTLKITAKGTAAIEAVLNL